MITNQGHKQRRQYLARENGCLDKSNLSENTCIGPMLCWKGKKNKKKMSLIKVHIKKKGRGMTIFCKIAFQRFINTNFSTFSAMPVYVNLYKLYMWLVRCLLSVQHRQYIVERHGRDVDRLTANLNALSSDHALDMLRLPES